MAEQLVEELLQGAEVVCIVRPEQRQGERDGQIQEHGSCIPLRSLQSLGSQQPSICTRTMLLPGRTYTEAHSAYLDCGLCQQARHSQHTRQMIAMRCWRSPTAGHSAPGQAQPACRGNGSPWKTWALTAAIQTSSPSSVASSLTGVLAGTKTTAAICTYSVLLSGHSSGCLVSVIGLYHTLASSVLCRHCAREYLCCSSNIYSACVLVPDITHLQSWTLSAKRQGRHDKKAHSQSLA